MLKQSSEPIDQAPSLNITDNVATLVLQRPSQHNRIAPEDSTLISEYVAEAASKARVLVITGTGSKTFSSGYTLGAIQDQLDSRFEDMLNNIENCSIPTICALNGSVYGGATDLALCCDIRIGITGSRFLMPASRIGLHYYPDGIRRYVGMLGLAASKQLFLTASPINDQHMLRIGFLNELVEPDQLHDTVKRYVDHIMQCEPKVLKTVKADLNNVAYGRHDPAVLRANYEASLASPELAARLALINK